MTPRILGTWTAFAAGLAAIASCSADSSSKAPVAKQAPQLELALEARGERGVVAEVNGVPIFGDCVKRQAEAHRLSGSEALDECIEFELLSQAANAPRFVSIAEVQEPAKQELVRSFVEAQYPYASADDLPDKLVEELWKQVSPQRYNYPQLRNVVFCRITLPQGATKESEESKRAAAYFGSVYERIKDRKGMGKNDLLEACYGPIELPDDERPYTKVGIEKVEHGELALSVSSGNESALQKAVFDGPEEVGMALPPLFSFNRWDLILLTQIIPQKTTQFEDAEAELRRALFEEAVYEPQREALFHEWYGPLEKKHKVLRSYEALPQSAPAPGDQMQPAPTPGGQP